MPLDPTLAARLAALEGLIPPALGECLHDLAAHVPPHAVIVEIGSYRGKSTCYLASGAPEGVTVYAVDPWDSPGNATGRFEFAHPRTFIGFLRQTGDIGLRDRIVPIRGFSTTVAKSWTDARPIGLLYVDGSHLEHDVRDDFTAWFPFLIPGAVVAFDDYDTPRNPGVKKVVDHLAVALGITVELGPRPLAILRMPHA